MPRQIEQAGWYLISEPYDPDQLQCIRGAVSSLSERTEESVRGREGAVYAARNVLELLPQLVHLWQTPELLKLLHEVLGSEVGLVRALYFDKPPDQTWALPWHKDLLIAVSDEAKPTPGYSRPRPRMGVLHCEPPVEVLEKMLTLRIHLDAMTLENGPLEVLSGSHRTGKKLQITGFEHATITSSAGSVFVMRPLLVHSSGRSIPNCTQHRRVLHLEFSGQPILPGGVIWNEFHPVTA